MNIPHLIKAGDTRLLLGSDQTPPKVDCRVWSEDSYQDIIKILLKVRRTDIQLYIDNESSLLSPQDRKLIDDFLSSNGYSI